MTERRTSDLIARDASQVELNKSRSVSSSIEYAVKGSVQTYAVEGVVRVWVVRVRHQDSDVLERAARAYHPRQVLFFRCDASEDAGECVMIENEDCRHRYWRRALSGCSPLRRRQFVHLFALICV